MKNNSLYFSQIKNLFNDYKFKIIFFMLVSLNIYALFDLPNTCGIFSGLYLIYSSKWVIAILILLISINSINVGLMYKNNYSLLIRYKNISVFLKKQIITALSSNFLILVMCLMLSSIGVILKNPQNLGIMYTFNGINVLIYFPILFIRLVVFGLLLSLVSFYSFYLFSKFCGIIVSMLLSLSIVVAPVSLEIIDSFVIFYGYYLLNPSFPNILVEIKWSIFQCLLLLLINLSLFKIITLKKKDI